MRTIQIPKELQPLLKFAEASEQDTVVFTDKKRPVAALVSLRKVDRESLALSTNPQFLRIIENSRKEIRAGRTISLEALDREEIWDLRAQQEVAPDAPKSGAPVNVGSLGRSYRGDARAKLIMQCSATKDARAGSFTVDGQRVKFVAHPELHGEARPLLDLHAIANAAR